MTVVIVRTIPPTLADLSISQRVIGEPFISAPIMYEVTVENRGPDRATGVVITDQLPAQLQAVSVLASPGACTITNSVVRCTVSQLPAGESIVLMLQGTATAVGLITNRAEVTAIETEPTPHDNLLILAVNVVPAPSPQLNIERNGNSFVIFWPGSASGFVLEGSETIPNPGAWMPVGGVALVNGRYEATVPNAAGTRFFRLRRL